MWRSLFRTITFGYSSSSAQQQQKEQQQPQEHQQDWWIETAHHDDSLLKCYSFSSSSSSFVWSRYSTFDHRNTTTNIIGQGSFGVVRKCQNRSTREWCACKSIAKNGAGGDNDLKQAVQREVENLQRIHNHHPHPHLIQLYGVWEDATHVHILTELCTGGELYDLIVSWKKQKATGLLLLPLQSSSPQSPHEAQCAVLLHDILQALQYLHEVHHMAHRDLKASNFLLTSSGQVKIIDFGLSKVVVDPAASASAATTTTTTAATSIHLMDTSTGTPGSTAATTTTGPQPTPNTTTIIAKPSYSQENHHDGDDIKKEDASYHPSRVACSSDETTTPKKPTTSPNDGDDNVPTAIPPTTTFEDGGGGYRTARSSFQGEDDDEDDDDDDEDDTTSTSESSQSHTHSDADTAFATKSPRSADTSLAYLSAASSSMSQHDDEKKDEADAPEAPSLTTPKKDIKTLYGVMTSEVGTPFFVAPEVLLEEEYTYLCDIWSIGVIAYLLLSQGHFPLDTFDERTSIRRLMDPHYTIRFPPETWCHVSSEAQDFCAQLLRKDPSQRPTARQALQHSWIRKHIRNSSVAAATTTTVQDGYSRSLV